MRTEPSPEEWRRRHELFQAALDLPPAQRAVFLAERCAGSPHLREEVEALLEAAAAADPWIAHSAEHIRRAARDALSAEGDEERTSDDEDVHGQAIGPYRIVRQVARGGMGTVYEAERADGQFEQRVALKLLRRGLDTDDILARFLAERQILASLAHPNIARLFDGGATADGRPYLVLEYVAGQPITDYCDARRLTIEQRLALFATVCRAVQHAHQHRILHRDIKPSNILVTQEGRVKLLDFGIAKLLGDADERPRTRTGVRLMTPDYASPEQLCGNTVTAASDVYQLGILLHELLTGTRPYRVQGRSAAEIERIVCREEVPRPSGSIARLRSTAGTVAGAAEMAHRRSTDPLRLRRTLRGDLDAIVLKALRKEPEDRYASAEALVEDLERYRQGLTVRARRGTLRYRARTFVRRNRRAALAALSGLLVGLLALAGALTYTLQREDSLRSTPAVRPVAVGQLRGYDAETAAWTGPVRDMLATSLSRISEIEVLSPARMAELVAQVQAEGDTVAAVARAARLGGAAELIEGTLHPHASGFQLDLRWSDLGSGRIRYALTVQGEEMITLAERATSGLAEWLGVTGPGGHLGDVTTRSLVAFRLYEEGVRAYYEGDNRAAQRLLTAALAEDSAFAMAAYYQALSNRDIDHAAFRSDLGRAYRFASRATDRERLLIHAAWAREMDEPRQLALAETLVARYPSAPDGHLFLAEALLWGGDFLRALPHLRRVVAMDSLSLHGSTPRCRACDALRDIATAYMLADSLAAAEREARAWVELQPGSAHAWHTLASTLEYQGRQEEARIARSQAARLRSHNPRDAIYPAVLAIRAGDFEAAERLLAERSTPDASLVQQNVLWYQTLSLRYQGRFAEALETARRYRRMVLDANVAGHPDLWAPVLEAQVLLDMGRPREAAALWHEMASADYEPSSPARSARHRAWTLTQVATARAAAGETAALAALADSIEVLGSQSAYGRDPRLHHHVRGLLLLARGDTAAAATAFRRAIFSGTAGYGRINLELGRALLALGQPEEAVRVLRAALRGPLDAGNLYVNRTELHALLARAYRASGMRDSAMIHYRHVLSAWERADPRLHDRREEIRQRLSALRSQAPPRASDTVGRHGTDPALYRTALPLPGTISPVPASSP